MTDQVDIDRAAKIILDNQNLEFVQRILNPEDYPNISDDERLPKGKTATHQMSWGQNAEKIEDATEFYVYPNIVNTKNGLHWFEDGAEAAKYSEESGERIVFDNAEDAEWFSSGGYKLIWPEDKR